MRECLSSIRNVVENAAGNLLGDLRKNWPLIAAWTLAAGQAAQADRLHGLYFPEARPLG